MEESKLVSIITPAYNAEPYLAAALDSALAQTYQRIEIIVVNNGSRDGTAEICRRYKGRIIYVELQDNVGVSAARKIGIEHSQGELITFLDADDLFLPKKVERQVAYLQEHPNCDLCYCDLHHFYDDEPDKKFTLPIPHYTGAAVFPNLLRRNFLNPLAVMVRRSTIGRCGTFDPTRRRAEDWELWLRLSYAGATFCYMPEMLAHYRITRVSLSRGKKNVVPERRAILSIFTDLRKRLPSEDANKYHLNRVVFRHRMRLWYAIFSSYVPFLETFRLRVQHKRLVGGVPKNNM